MRRITVSVLSVLVVLPVMADARLPVVNVAAGGVSARAAFGDVVPQKSVAPVASTVAAVDAKPTVAKNTVSKKVVARNAAKNAPQKASPTRPPYATVDNGGELMASSDVLSPRRPSADLWARSDAPLRLPDPTEFSVIRADYDLPEESLNTTPRAAVVARNNDVPARRPAAQPMSELDGQISRLVELQRRADDSVRNVASTRPTRVISAPIADMPAKTETVAVANTSTTAATTEPVKLSRMVVPMAPDAVVRTVEKNTSPRIATVRDDMTKLSPTELRKAFRKTFLSENKHLSTFQIDDRFDVASDMSTNIEGFTAKRDLSEDGGIRPLEIKIRFRNDDSALSRDNYNLLSEYASIVVNNPKRAIQIAIPETATRNMDARKLAARRLAIVEQVLRDTGVSEQRIMPVLAQRDDEGFLLRIISSDQYETLTRKQRDIFGDTVNKKSYKSMSW